MSDSTDRPDLNIEDGGQPAAGGFAGDGDEVMQQLAAAMEGGGGGPGGAHKQTITVRMPRHPDAPEDNPTPEIRVQILQNQKGVSVRAITDGDPANEAEYEALCRLLGDIV